MTTRILRSARTVLTGSPERKTTLKRTDLRNRRGRPGFTLIEVLIVIAIIAMVMAVGLPAISRVTLQRLNSTTRQFVGLIRTLRNDSILLNTVHRLAIDFEKKTYWVEEQSKPGLLVEQTDRPKPKKGSKDEAPPSNFTLAARFNKEPKPMPGGVEFTGVFKEREGVRNDGVAYVHFFPNGFNDAAILYLAKEGSPETTYSLMIRPTSGRVEIFPEIVKDFNYVPRQ